MEPSEQFRHAVEEYRFQVDLNWKRSEYYFVLNVAVLVAAIGLLATSARVPREILGVLFTIAALLAGLSIVANVVQHRYYRSTRDEVKRLRGELGLPESTVATTPGLGSTARRLARVRTFQVIMLSALLLADVGGAVYSFATGARGPDVRLLVRVALPEAPKSRARLVLVLSEDGEVRRQISVRPRQDAPVAIAPGTYRVSTYARARLCGREVEVSEAPLQRFVLECPSR